MEFSRQEYWGGLPFPSPGILPNPGIEPGSPSLQANFLPSVLPGKPQSHQKTILFQTSRSRGLKLAISWNNRKQRRRKEIKNTCCTFWLVMKFKSWSSHIWKRTFYGWARDFESYLCVCVCKSLSGVQLFVTPWTVAPQAPLSIEFFRQEYCSGLPFPSPGELPYTGLQLGSPAGRVFTIWAIRETHHIQKRTFYRWPQVFESYLYTDVLFMNSW